MSQVPWKTDKWFVSHYNFAEEVRKKTKLPESVKIHDITLRDGEQQANIIFRKDDKLKIARMLDEAGVHRIEAGMPAVSPEDYEAVKEIAGLGLNTKVFSFARCMKNDVDLALKCDVEGVVMEIPSSDHILRYAYGWSEEKAIKLSVEATQYAGDHGLHVAFFTIDSTRAEFETCWRLINAVATEGHMDSLVIVDTFGVCTPEAIGHFVSRIKERVDKPLAIHVHNDFGLGVANAISAVGAGAEIVHTTVNGIGERMGNSSLEETVLCLELLYGVKTGVKKEKLYEASRLVQDLARTPVAANKAIVGPNIFKVESGIIAAWWRRLRELKMPLEMMPYLPELVGQPAVELVLGKKSGLDSVAYKLEQLGLSRPSEEKLNEILQRVKAVSMEKKRTLTDDEFRSILKQQGP
ncbi:MAG: LeuA family protein [Candidatus Bathyarchaeia archaeon]